MPVVRRQFISRRQALSVIALSAGALAGCGIPSQGVGQKGSASLTSSLSKKATLVINTQDIAIVFGHYFSTLLPRLRDTWEAENPNVTLSLSQQPGIPDLMPVLGDSVNGDISLVPLRPILQPLGFDWGAIPPAVLRSFSDSNGVPLALPVVLGEIQFYVNHVALRKLGVNKSQWSFADMQTVLEMQRLALGATSQAPLMVGLLPSTLNLWASLALGLGGKFTFTSDSLDVQALTTPTSTLISFAQRYRWVPSAVVATANRNFYGEGFAGAASSALFAFVPPWTGVGTQSTPPRNLVPLPFPTFPHSNNIPATQVGGMGIRVESHYPELAARFLTWLYNAKQQELLISLGLPPSVTSSGLETAWSQFQAQQVAKGYPIFSAAGYFDIQSLSPNPAVAFPRAPLVQIFTTGTVGAGLQQLQQEYQQRLTAEKSVTLPKGY